MKAVVLFSGGADSTTLLASVLQNVPAEEVLALNVFYGQRHEREMQSAREIAECYGVELMTLDLAEIFSRSNCSLLSKSAKPVKIGPYAEQIRKSGGNPVETYVPFRNGLMLSAAASVAFSIGADTVYYGAHADDAAGNAYPDCSTAFIKAMNDAVYQGTGGEVVIDAPFAMVNKSEVIKVGIRLRVPYEKTWSCYNGGEQPCGKCGTCIDRKAAFEANGVNDPLQ